MASQAPAPPRPPSPPSDHHVEKPKKKKSRRPANTAFRQQRLKAWQPVLTPKTVLPLLFAVGIVLAPIGALLLWSSAMVEEIAIDYTDCRRSSPLAPQWGDIPNKRVSKHFKITDYGTGTPASWQHRQVMIPYDGVNLSTTICSLQFDILNSIGPPVLFYYRLTNFYQNHRRYVKSFDPDQLKGQAKSKNLLSGDCHPLLQDGKSGKAIFPCGLLANSLFNDTFSSPVLTNTQNSSKDSMTYFMTNKGISWPSDRELYGVSAYKVQDVVPPPNWRNRYPHGYTIRTGLPNLRDDEAFQVWMRTAGLPNFSKLARRNDTTSMPPGRYQVDIRDYFPVSEYGGTKSILISTRSILGGKNPFLGFAYIIMGGICILLGTLFTAAHLIKPRKLGDHTYLTWNKETYGGGGASGSRGGVTGGRTSITTMGVGTIMSSG